MSKGKLLAVGTSEFIKKKFGEGYNLRLGLPLLPYLGRENLK